MHDSLGGHGWLNHLRSMGGVRPITKYLNKSLLQIADEITMSGLCKPFPDLLRHKLPTGWNGWVIMALGSCYNWALEMAHIPKSGTLTLRKYLSYGQILDSLYFGHFDLNHLMPLMGLFF